MIFYKFFNNILIAGLFFVQLTFTTKILFVVNKFPKLTETFILSQMTGLIDKGYDLSIWSQQGDETTLEQTAVAKYKLLDKHRFINFYDKSTHNEIVRLLKKEQFDIIYCLYDRIGVIFASLKKQFDITGKLVTCVRGGDICDRVKKKSRQYKTLFQEMDFILPVSYFFKKQLISCGCLKEKIIVHHSAIDVKKFCYIKRNMNPKVINVVTTARLMWSKGVDIAVKAMAQVCKKYSNVHYIIIGDGKLKNCLKEMIKQLGSRAKKNIKLAGWQKQDDIIKTLSQAHIFLLSSVAAEGIPNAIMEAAATGLPIVSTYYGGIPEIVEDNVSGFLVPIENSNSLAKKVEKLVTDPRLRIKMGRKGSDYVLKEHNIFKENEKLYQLFESLLNNK
jgi:colanic acid/amylovoran biosynthesis glycosyltransferase